ncbi:hypothetical protein [Methylosinus sporium]|uniref:Uncharacterized protein n=1 Tax=Methylosinus sporium TaxID=428 RepID=A0A2U1SSQ5_METSR|nr:hypothetical protein [Methylosinus sporium]PWB94649.1 hypothetical protein C5689_06190 [Methylosinus sporium]
MGALATKTIKDGAGANFTERCWDESGSGDGPYQRIGQLAKADGTVIDPAQDGVDGTGISAPSGGSGIRGWLSGIYQRLGALLSATAPADANRVPVSQRDMLTIGPSSVTSAAVLFSQDVSGFGSLALQVTSIGAGNTIVYEASNDNSTWYFVSGYSPLLPASDSAQYLTTLTDLLLFPCVAKYFRARVSSYGSGTVTVVTALRFAPLNRSDVFIGNVTSSPVPISFSGLVVPASSAIGAMTRARVASAASTNATSVKATEGRLYEIHVANTSAAMKFLKLYDKASAPTVGTDMPVATYPIAANGGRIDIVSINGQSFPNGLAYAITGAVGDADTTAVAANDVTGELLYA